MSRKDVLEFLNRDRKVDDKFIERLEKEGFEVYCGKYCYWNNQKYVKIGNERIWLVQEWYEGNNCGLRYRKRNAVVTDIKTAMKEQLEILKKEDEEVENFFKEHGGNK